jgi:hypothetical protein
MSEPTEPLLSLNERLLRSIVTALHAAHRRARPLSSFLFCEVIFIAYIARVFLVDGGPLFGTLMAHIASLLAAMALPMATLPPVGAAVAFVIFCAALCSSAAALVLSIQPSSKSSTPSSAALTSLRFPFFSLSALPLLYLNALFEPIDCFVVNPRQVGLCALPSPLPPIFVSLSALALLVLLPLLFLSVVPHAIDPRSFSYAAAACPHLSIASHATLVVAFVLQRLAAGAVIPSVVPPIISMRLSFALGFSYVLLQPFHHGLINHVRAGVSSFGAITALIAAISSSSSQIPSIASLGVSAPVFLAGVTLSAVSRRQLTRHFVRQSSLRPAALRHALRLLSIDNSKESTSSAQVAPHKRAGRNDSTHPAFSSYPQEINETNFEQECASLLSGPLSDEEVFSAPASAYLLERPDSLVDSFLAAVEDGSTRFLSGDAANYPKWQMSCAEVLLKRAMIRHPQSTFLRVRFVIFLLFVKRDLPRAQVRLEELARVKSEHSLFYVVHSLRSALRTNTANEDDVDDAGAEQVAEAARKGTRMAQVCRRHIATFWRALE